MNDTNNEQDREQDVTEQDSTRMDAAELDDLAHVPDDVLSVLVARHGLCLWEITHGDPPMWTGDGLPDRELAARLCAGCPVRRECLEFELRTAGPHTVGVWGGLSEDDRRALHAVWQARASLPHPARRGRTTRARTNREEGRRHDRNHLERG